MSGIRLDPSGAFIAGTGVTRGDFERLHPRMEAIRREMVETDMRLVGTADIPREKQPLDAAFLDLPERILAEYRRVRETSELGKLLKIARRLQESVDRVVVLGIGGSYMGARALMEACCQPYFNELSRGDRGSKPRMYFEGNNVDNDSVQGLLHLLGNGRAAQSRDERWAIIVISKSGATMETAVAFRIFVERLRNAVGDAALGEYIIPVTGPGSRLESLAKELGCRDLLPVPEGVGGRFSILSSVGLLPAAVLGLNVIDLLEGAVSMTNHFRAAPPGNNVVLDFANLCHLAERQGAHIRVLSVWSKALEGAGLWYDQLLAESLGKDQLGATPLTVVNTRDLHSRAQQHQEGRKDKLFVNATVGACRTDSLRVGRSLHNHDGLNDLAERTLPEIMGAAIAGTNEALRGALRPTIDLGLPTTNERTMGQFFQMLMLATVVEGRLLGVNPYGQPGVEAYKRNMNRLLGRGV